MANDITIPIAAKDQASAILENVGKSSQKLAGNVDNLSRVTEQSTKAMNSAFSGLKSALGPLIGVFAAFKAATFSVDFLRSSSEAFDVQQEAIRGLTKAIELSGDAVGPTIEQHQAFASALQGVVNVGDEVTLGLMKQASTLGVSNEELQDTTKAAIGLAEATGMSLNEAMKKIVGAVNGNSAALGEMIPELRSATTESERLAIIQRMASDGLQQAADRAQTAEGAATRLANSWGDFKEIIGQLLAPIRQVIASGLATLVEVISASVIPALNSIMPTTEQISAAMEMMRVGITKAITFAEVVIGNFGKIWELVKASAELQIIQIIEIVKHAFTVQIPGYASWFGRNFVNLLRDGLMIGVTVVQNHIQKMAEIILRLWDFVRSGFSGGAEQLFSDIGEIASRSLLDGFVPATVEQLPNIAARALTDREKELTATITGLAGDLGQAYQDKLAERLGAAGAAGADALGLSLKAGAAEAIEEIANETQSNLGGLAAAARRGSGGELSPVAASESRLLTRGPGSRLTLEELLVEVVRNTKMTANLLDDSGAAQAAIESATRETADALANRDSVKFVEAPT